MNAERKPCSTMSTSEFFQITRATRHSFLSESTTVRRSLHCLVSNFSSDQQFILAASLGLGQAFDLFSH
jgi:hypothetical protein